MGSRNGDRDKWIIGMEGNFVNESSGKCMRAAEGWLVASLVWRGVEVVCGDTVLL